jgi:uroporphyrinogen-III decarboxylase
VRRCLEAGSAAPRFVINVGGQLTHDIPVAHLEYYLAVRKRLGGRWRDLRRARLTITT